MEGEAIEGDGEVKVNRGGKGSGGEERGELEGGRD